MCHHGETAPSWGAGDSLRPNLGPKFGLPEQPGGMRWTSQVDCGLSKVAINVNEITINYSAMWSPVVVKLFVPSMLCSREAGTETPFLLFLLPVCRIVPTICPEQSWFWVNG